jgi:hypothetical protein
MKNFFREAADWTSEALETACGWALYVAIAYAVFFVDFTGRGPVWSHVASMWREGRPAPAVAKHEGVRVIKLGAPSEKRDDGVGLVAQLDYKYLTGQREEEKAVVGVNHDRRVEMTDAPADLEASSKKDWKRSLQGELRTFAVYGNGEQTSSANAAVPQSAYAAGADSPTARPAISGRARALSQNGSDSVRNFK